MDRFSFYKLEYSMAPHSNILAWKIPWTEKPDRLQSMGSLELDTTERLHFHFSLSCNREGNGNPLQSSCLENPRDGGSWWAAVYGVTQSRTRLKWLSSNSSSKPVWWSQTFLTPGTRFMEDHLQTRGRRDGFRMIQVHCIYYAHYLFIFYISSTIAHQSFDPRGW